MPSLSRRFAPAVFPGLVERRSSALPSFTPFPFGRFPATPPLPLIYRHLLIRSGLERGSGAKQKPREAASEMQARHNRLFRLHSSPMALNAALSLRGKHGAGLTTKGESYEKVSSHYR
jgi:hypothetical protein